MEKKLSEIDRAILSKHVTNIDDDVYVVYNLPPEVKAVLFAYVSRSPASFRDNLLKLIKEKSLDIDDLVNSYTEQGMDYHEAKKKAKEFHEKWVVGYGHSSVAEHAVVSVALENISEVAGKVVQDNRLASYTAKSSRYQVYSKESYIKPKKLLQSSVGDLYVETMDFLFDEYTKMYHQAYDYVVNEYPNTDNDPKWLYENKSKARACDIVRYTLPAGSLMNMAMTANARVYERAISKMLSHESEEVQLIGQKLKNEIQKIIPTLVKYAEKNDYMIDTEIDMARYTSEEIKFEDRGREETVVLVKYDQDAYERIITAILYRYSLYSYAQIENMVKKMNDQEKDKILREYLGKMGKHDYPLRELEYANYTFDLLMDYGAFRDVQRHRMCTQTNQKLTTEYGYCIPEKMDRVGLMSQFEQCMSKAADAYDKISKLFPFEAQYVVPMAYRKRVLINWNLRSLFHFIKLRSGKEGHIAYRRVAMACYDEVCRVHPLLGKYLVVDKTEGPSR